MPIALVADDSAEGRTRCDSGDEFDRSDHWLADPPGPSVTLPVEGVATPAGPPLPQFFQYTPVAPTARLFG